MKRRDQERSRKRAATRSVTKRYARRQQPSRGARRPKAGSTEAYVPTMTPKR